MKNLIVPLFRSHSTLDTFRELLARFQNRVKRRYLSFSNFSNNFFEYLYFDLSTMLQTGRSSCTRKYVSDLKKIGAALRLRRKFAWR